MSAPWFFEEHLDLPLETGAVGAAGSMLGSGAIVVMDETTDVVKAGLLDRLATRILAEPHSRDEELEWVRRKGPWAPGLLDHLKRQL